MTKPPPQKRRNAQIRTYWRLLQFAISRELIINPERANALYNELQKAKQRIDKNTQDSLKGIDVEQLVATAQKLLGFEGGESR